MADLKCKTTKNAWNRLQLDFYINWFEEENAHIMQQNEQFQQVSSLFP